LKIAAKLFLLKLSLCFFQPYVGSMRAFFIRLIFAKVSTIKVKRIFFFTVEFINYIDNRYVNS